MTWSMGSPNPKQLRFFKARSRFVAYGGARGGGKSWGIRKKSIGLALRYGGIRVLIMRRTFPELRQNHILPMMAELDGIAAYKEMDKTFYFKNGSAIIFGYCNTDKDVLQYQGNEYDIIFMDEATQFTEYQYTTLTASLRGANNFPKRMYLTCNPGGVGHGWVKRLFIDRSYRGKELAEDYEFISATVFDNSVLMDNDPGYVQMLENLPEKKRRMWLLGDWDVFEGQVFTEWRNDPEHYKDRLWTHVVEPFGIPADWKIWRSYDYGYSKPFSVGWSAVDHDGKIWRIRELYGADHDLNGESLPNVGRYWRTEQQAEEIRKIEETDPNLKGRKIINAVADPAIFAQNGGESIAQMMARPPYRVYWQPGDNTRMAGLMQYHNRLAFDANGQCKFQVFSTCRDFIRTLPLLIYDEHKVEDIDTELEDHAYDECRYLFMANPTNPPPKAEKLPPTDGDPLNLWQDKDRTGTEIPHFTFKL